MFMLTLQIMYYGCGSSWELWSKDRKVFNPRPDLLFQILTLSNKVKPKIILLKETFMIIILKKILLYLVVIDLTEISAGNHPMRRARDRIQINLTNHSAAQIYSKSQLVTLSSHWSNLFRHNSTHHKQDQ